MALKEKARAEQPTMPGRAKMPAPAAHSRAPAPPSPVLHGPTSQLSEHATPIQRARESITMQQHVGNARVSLMAQAGVAPTVTAKALPQVIPPKPVVAAPEVSSKPKAPGEMREKPVHVLPQPAFLAGKKATTPTAPPAQAERSLKKDLTEPESKAKTPAAVAGKEGQVPPHAKTAAAVGDAESAPEAAETKAKAPTSGEGKTGPVEGKSEDKAKATAGEAPSAEGEGEAGAPAAGGAKGPAIKVALHMPEPPSEVSPATAKRIQGVQARAGGAASAHAAMPSGAAQVGDARQAATQPDAEAKAHAQADLIALLGEQPAPSPEIVKLCERIREVIRKKRPPDQDALMEAKPEGEALNAGNQLNSTVEGETKKVQDNYGAIDNPPAGAPPQKGQELPPQPGAAATPGVNAKAATPDAVPPGNVSLDADAADSKKKMKDAGMETPAAQLVQSGPVAEARGAQGELDQAAKEDPAKVLAEQKQTLAKAEDDMAALQQQALSALTTSRSTTVKGSTSQQHGMVGSEESMRVKASAEAQQVFTNAQKSVTSLLQPVASNAISEWEAAKEVLVSKFKADLAIVQKRVEERHAGVGGFVVGLWDAVVGLPDWAEEAYTNAEKNFGDGVIAKITEISVKVNTIIATCEALIKDARQKITKIFSDLPGSLGAWAAQEQAKFDGKLDQLHNQAISTRDNFNKDLTSRASEAVDDVRSQIAELRKKAGGLVGRIVSAVNRFLDDPVKFIIEGLLELLGIPPAAFWAVVAKIKKVVKDIADDPMKFAGNLLAGLGQGFSLFFDNILMHLLKGFLSWLLGGLGDVGVQLPKDLSLKSIVTFFLQLMGITWPRIRKILAKHVGEKNVALLEKVYSLVSFLIEKGPEGIYEMIKEKLDPQAIVDQVVQLAVEYMITAVVKAVAARIILLFNPAGAILQALEAIYKVLKWIFQNAARIFTLVETVVNGIADVIAGNVGGFAKAVEKALAMLIAPVISFIADYLGFGDLPDKIADKVKSFQEWILGLIEKALVWIIEKGKALLAAFGIGKKDDKKDDKGGTPHEQAVHEVATTLAQPMDDKPLDYDALRAAKEKEASSLVAIHNQALAADHVKMSVTFADRASDQADHDIDFKVRITPNDTEEANSVPVPVPEPVAGLHVVKRSPPFESVAGESHHVPAKGLGTGIAQFLDEVANSLRAGEWQGDPAAEAVASAFSDRANDNRAAAAKPAEGLSAILLCPEAHTEEGGVHTVEGSGPVLAALAANSAGRAIVQVKRRTASQIAGVASFIAVNPQIASWRLFLADVRRAVDDPGFRNHPGVAPGDQRAADLILDQAQKEFMDIDESSHKFLEDRVLKRTNEVLDRGVGDAYTSGKATVSAAMNRANDGTPEGRKAALSSLDGHFGSSWGQFRKPIRS